MTLMQPPAAQPQAQQSSDRPGLAYGTGLWDWPMGLACGTGLWDWPVGLEIDHRGRAAPCAAGLAFSGLNTAGKWRLLRDVTYWRRLSSARMGAAACWRERGDHDARRSSFSADPGYRSRQRLAGAGRQPTHHQAHRDCSLR